MAGIGGLISLAILLIVVAGGAFIGYQVYLWSNELAARGKNHMEKKNMSFTKDGGLRVGVKDIGNEAYFDKTQNVLVNTWNNAALPNYKSRLGWNSTQAQDAKKGSPSPSPRPGASRHASSSSNVSRPQSARAPSGATGLQPPSSSYRRSGSPVPGSFD